MVYLLNYMPYSKDKAIEALENQVGWKNYGGKHHESVYTRFVQSYIQPVKFNLDYRRATFSSQICAGEISREQAMKELESLPYEMTQVKKDKDYASKKFGIPLQEFEGILHASPKSYKDYPNDEKWLTLIYTLYIKYFRS